MIDEGSVKRVKHRDDATTGKGEFEHGGTKASAVVEMKGGVVRSVRFEGMKGAAARAASSVAKALEGKPFKEALTLRQEDLAKHLAATASPNDLRPMLDVLFEAFHRAVEECLEDTLEHV